MTSRLTALSVLCVAAAGSLGAPAELGALGCLLPLVALLLGPRLKLGAGAELGLTFGVALVAIISVRLLVPEPYEHDLSMLSERELLFMLPLLMIAGLRALALNPRFGVRLTLVIGLLALTLAGGALSNHVFPALAALYAVLGLAAFRSADPLRLPLPRFGAKNTAALGLCVLVVAGMVGVSGVVAPRVHARLMDAIQQRFRASRVGFSGSLELGDLTELMTDSRVVLRVRGPDPPELLRGAVFNEYHHGRWFSKRHVGLTTVARIVAAGQPGTPGDRRVEIEYARRPERYFLPAGALDVTTSVGAYTRDEFGIVYPPDDGFAKRVWFDRAEPRLPSPDPEDLLLPSPLRPELEGIARAWGAMTGSPAERLARLSRGLERYRYALSFERRSAGDPVLDFLRKHPEGHCEYFASAMVLLARSASVPARLVSGYRVHEVSPFGYSIVRREHAHSWVEAWVDGAWHTFDPTPVAEFGATSQTPLLGALWDGALSAWAAADDWLEQRTTFELALALLTLGGALVLVRSLGSKRPTESVTERDGSPLPGFQALQASLGDRGLGRAPSETLARFAERVEHAEHLPSKTRHELKHALHAYAVLRYSGRGDPEALDRSLRELARRL